MLISVGALTIDKPIALRPHWELADRDAKAVVHELALWVADNLGNQ